MIMRATSVHLIQLGSGPDLAHSVLVSISHGTGHLEHRLIALRPTCDRNANKHVFIHLPDVDTCPSASPLPLCRSNDRFHASSSTKIIGQLSYRSSPRAH